MKSKFIYNILLNFCVIFSLSINISLSQSKKDLENQKKKTLEEIEYTNKLLETTKNKEKENTNNLFIIEKRISSRKKLINQTIGEVKIISNQIENYELGIKYMEEDLKYLSESYANLIRMAWKNKNKQNAFMFVLASKDFNQSYLRIKYLKDISYIRKQQLSAIKSIKPLLEESKIRLETDKQLKEDLLEELGIARKTLENEQQQQQQEINKLKKQSKTLEQQLQQQQQQYKNLQAKIDKIIAEEIEAAKRKSKAEQTELSAKEKTLSANFANNIGILPSPLEQGIITKQFGVYPHPAMPNIKINCNGIEITTTAGSQARAVFDGVVSSVVQITGMHYVVLIKHGEYYTVYANLTDISVKKDDEIKTKQNLGKVYTNTNENKTILYFEIRKGTVLQNPNDWLSIK